MWDKLQYIFSFAVFNEVCSVNSHKSILWTFTRNLYELLLNTLMNNILKSVLMLRLSLCTLDKVSYIAFITLYWSSGFLPGVVGSPLQILHIGRSPAMCLVCRDKAYCLPFVVNFSTCTISVFEVATVVKSLHCT